MTLGRKNEINIIAYQIPNSNDIILGRRQNKEFIVRVSSGGIVVYSTPEMEEVYSINVAGSDFERLGWAS